MKLLAGTGGICFALSSKALASASPFWYQKQEVRRDYSRENSGSLPAKLVVHVPKDEPDALHLQTIDETIVEAVNGIITLTTTDGQRQHCTPWPAVIVDDFLKRVDLNMLLAGDSREFCKRREQSGIEERNEEDI
ncbi:uncharacterized protein CTHT_0073950 [Thermochaetoides thermophila DSM 1495]|uniref:Uncharacterized protein n=1 Tax=Chaetomium thermophilum (strain DSM 1495 / CBS 144.50 / IMI 039719) TaxID=759272 RepID=G0SHZ7_CHATD|nr:hypothetical protein CTHT_0073950 [Thermochaetoides thermophila DSM 1495]EGS17067.1 hypothetical protein CTHT_0073950 [Thermochaetoides thermophila DSM 1495]